MKKFEYIVVSATNSESLEEVLNKHGALGWQYKSHTVNANGRTIIFEREKK